MFARGTDFHGHEVEEPTSGLHGVHKSRSQVVISSAVSAENHQDEALMRADTETKCLHSDFGGCYKYRPGVVMSSEVPAV